MKTGSTKNRRPKNAPLLTGSALCALGIALLIIYGIVAYNPNQAAGFVVAIKNDPRIPPQSMLSEANGDPFEACAQRRDCIEMAGQLVEVSADPGADCNQQSCRVVWVASSMAKPGPRDRMEVGDFIIAQGRTDSHHAGALRADAVRSTDDLLMLHGLLTGAAKAGGTTAGVLILAAIVALMGGVALLVGMSFAAAAASMFLVWSLLSIGMVTNTLPGMPKMVESALYVIAIFVGIVAARNTWLSRRVGPWLETAGLLPMVCSATAIASRTLDVDTSFWLVLGIGFVATYPPAAYGFVAGLLLATGLNVSPGVLWVFVVSGVAFAAVFRRPVDRALAWAATHTNERGPHNRGLEEIAVALEGEIHRRNGALDIFALMKAVRG